VLFTVVFSVVLAMGAFAIDQGLAYGKHGVAQSNADTASRAGARQCLLSLSAGASPANACDNSAELAAEANGAANLVDAADVNSQGGSDCRDEGSSDFPAITVDVSRTSSSLFLRSVFRLFGSDIGDFTATAQSTACVGKVSELLQPNTLDGVPMWFTQPNCGGGPMCIIYSSGSAVSWSGFFRRPSSGFTCGPNGAGQIPNRLQNGMTANEYPCSAPAAGTPGTPLQNASVSSGSVLNAFEGRLPSSGEPCVLGGSRTRIDLAVTAVLTTVSGGTAWPIGAVGSNPTVYQQQDCTSNRLVLVPLVRPLGVNRIILGFAGVYLVGCGRDDQGAPSQLNDCGANSRGYRDGGPCQQRDHRGNCTDNSRTRVWGIVLRMYLPGDEVQDLQGIVTTGSSGWVGSVAALGLQTTR